MKTSSEGFTLIELLVVIVIVGALSAIALPSFLNQLNKAASREAMLLLSSLMRREQEYFLENNEFSPAPGTLSTAGLKHYEVVVDDFTDHQTLDGETVSGLRFRAIPQRDSLDYVMGKVWIADNDVKTVLCNSESNGAFMNSKTYCPE